MTGRPLSRNPACVAVLLLTLAPPARIHAEDEPPVTLVGMRGHLDGVVLPGSELEVRPLEDSQAPFVLRIDTDSAFVPQLRNFFRSRNLLGRGAR